MSLIDHRFILERHLRDKPAPLSAFSFAGLLLWEDFFRYRLETIDGCLCVFADGELGTFMALPPLGAEVSPETVAACFQAMEAVNGPVGVSRIECVPEAMKVLFSTEDYTLHPRSPEYGYLREALAGLRGNAYKSQRWACNHFMNHAHYRYEAWHPSMTEACLALYDAWAQERQTKNDDPVYVQMITDSRSALVRAMAHADLLGLIGRVVFVQDRLAAFTFGFPLSDEVFCVAFEAADNTVKGLPAFIFRAFCADPALERYPLINAMDDFALEQVARVKRSYHPVTLWPSWTVSRRKGIS